MSKPGRVRRKQPARTGPVRSFAGIINDAAAAQGSANGNRPPQSDPIAESVSNAYEVIDRYVNEGRKAAEGMAGDGKRVAPPPAAKLEALLEEMVRRQSELLPLWLDLMGAVAAAELPRTMPSDSGFSGQHGRSTVVVEISSRRPAQVQVDLTRRLAPEALVISGAHPVEGGAPPITDIALANESGIEVLKIRVSDEQPLGIYAAVLLERATGKPCGSVTIRIL
jgi:hypothetical protein